MTPGLSPTRRNRVRSLVHGHVELAVANGEEAQPIGPDIHAVYLVGAGHEGIPGLDLGAVVHGARALEDISELTLGVAVQRRTATRRHPAVTHIPAVAFGQPAEDDALTHLFGYA